MSDSVRTHRQQPTRLPRPWDSPGKNTGVGCHFLLQCRKVKSESEVAQSCPTLWDPIDGSPPGSPIPGILQARTLEWVAISFSSAWKWKVKVKSHSCVQLLATPCSGVGCHRLLQPSRPNHAQNPHLQTPSPMLGLKHMNSGDSCRTLAISN